MPPAMVSSFWAASTGDRDGGSHPQAVRSGVLLALGLALAFFAAVSLFPVQTLSLFTKNAAIVAEGTAYR